MRFVDEATITVSGGNGGHGCLSFRREAFIPMGGPDGGDGGAGGSIYLQTELGLGTLVEFRYNRAFRARSGDAGSGNQRTGRSGADVVVPVPVGTVVRDADTGELIGDLTQPGERLLVAKGGSPGIGNTRFKSSTNRSPRRITLGKPGEERRLLLELKLLADVGFLGAPNAGKSTLLRAISAARPQVADYPFTTLYPHLGVVRVDAVRSFVAADIPGLIEGSAQGAGLGIQFLKHLARTRLLLHVVDLAPLEPRARPARQIEKVLAEVQAFSAELAALPRWLVLNKVDALTPAQRRGRVAAIRRAFGAQIPIHVISAVTGEGCRELCSNVANYLTQLAAEPVPESPEEPLW